MDFSIAGKLATGLIAALALSPVCIAQSEVAGDWQGTLSAGGNQFRIAWHITAAKDGTLTTTVDNLDEGVYGVPVKTMTVNGSSVTQSVDTTIQINGESHDVRGSFAGTIDKDATEIKGTWKQTAPEEGAAEMDLKHMPAQAATKPAPLPVVTGDWQGTLSAAGAQFRIAWHVTAAKDGTLTATIDNLDQGIYGIPMKSMTMKGLAVTQAMDTTIQMNGEPHDVRGTFEGTIDKDATEVKGTWTQTEPEQAPAEVDLKHVPAQAATKPVPLPM
jgi:hypothetical protein